MNTQKNHLVGLVGISILWLAGAGAPIVFGQSGRVASSYGPINQDTTIDQIKASRLAVKAERAQAHIELKMQIAKDQLVPLATTVDSGVSEVIRKQEMGYAYIKSGG